MGILGGSRRGELGLIGSSVAVLLDKGFARHVALNHGREAEQRSHALQKRAVVGPGKNRFEIIRRQNIGQCSAHLVLLLHRLVPSKGNNHYAVMVDCDLPMIYGGFQVANGAMTVSTYMLKTSRCRRSSSR